MPVTTPDPVNAISDAFTFSIWTGVLAGIATSILIGLARRLWISSIKPGIEDILYRDAKIEGRWKAQFSESSVDPERVRKIIDSVRRNEQTKLLKAIKEVAAQEKAKKIQEEISDTEKQEEKKETQQKPSAKAEKKQKDEEQSWIHTFAITLNRKGHLVTGTMLGTTGGNEGRNYELKGSFRNMILTGTYESTDRSEIERGCFSLMLKNNGSCLHGYIVAYSDPDHELGAVRTTWTRHRASA